MSQIKNYLVIFLFCLQGSSVFATGVTKEVYPYYLGTSRIDIEVYQAPRTGFQYVHVHENEKASLQAVMRIIATYGGQVVTLKHGGGRFISFTYKGERYVFDPNRIFSRDGVQKTLKFYSKKYNPVAAKMVNQFAEVLRQKISPHFIIAVHNNHKGGYSIQSYLPRSVNSQGTMAVYTNSRNIKDDFFLVTKIQFFNFLKERHFNVILEKAASHIHPGSLSLYAHQHNIPYINVEARQGALRAQYKMLEALQELK